MNVSQVLHMNGGKGDTSYANNSSLQRKGFSKTIPFIEEAITSLYRRSYPASLAIADLGCSSGSNTFYLVSLVMEYLNKLTQNLGNQPPECQVFMNDLPGNDFNNIFRSLHTLKKHVGPCYVVGVPGSFYNRLFPSNSLHFIHSNCSLQWLSQVPQGLEENKANIYISNTSPPSVYKAYYEQFHQDFSTFLKCRSEELVVGGCMVLTIMGRKGKDPSSKESSYLWGLLADALNEMVSMGTIEEHELNSFNLPEYIPSPEELKYEIESEGSFNTDRLEVIEVNWNAYVNEFKEDGDVSEDDVPELSKVYRTVAESMLVDHFGETIIDELFLRFKEIVADRMVEEFEFVSIAVSMTKKNIS